MNNLDTTEAKRPNSRRTMVHTVAGVAMFAALGFVLSLATSWIKVSGFLSVDIKDAILAIGAFIYGPVASIPMALISVVLEAVIIGTTGPIGAIMDFMSTLTFVLTASLIYKYHRTVTGAIIGFAAAIFTYTAVMIPLNLLLTPLYTMQPIEVVKEMLLPLLIPFNFGKSLINSAVSLIIYKPISTALSLVGIAPRASGFRFGKGTIITLGVAVSLAAIAIIVFIVIG